MVGYSILLLYLGGIADGLLPSWPSYAPWLYVDMALSFLIASLALGMSLYLSATITRPKALAAGAFSHGTGLVILLAISLGTA